MERETVGHPSSEARCQWDLNVQRRRRTRFTHLTLPPDQSGSRVNGAEFDAQMQFLFICFIVYFNIFRYWLLWFILSFIRSFPLIPSIGTCCSRPSMQSQIPLKILTQRPKELSRWTSHDISSSGSSSDGDNMFSQPLSQPRPDGKLLLCSQTQLFPWEDLHGTVCPTAASCIHFLYIKLLSNKRTAVERDEDCTTSCHGNSNGFFSTMCICCDYAKIVTCRHITTCTHRKYTSYHLHNWLVVSTPLKNISQLGWLFPIVMGK